jgi:hypothetical protein
MKSLNIKCIVPQLWDKISRFYDEPSFHLGRFLMVQPDIRNTIHVSILEIRLIGKMFM